MVTRESLVAAFERADLNGDGTLSRREFEDALDRLGLGLSQFEVERVVARADADRSGTVDYAEFASLILPAGDAAEGTGECGGEGRRVAAQWLAQARADGRDPGGHVAALPRNSSGRVTRRALRHAASDMGLKMTEAQWRGVLDGACSGAEGRECPPPGHTLMCPRAPLCRPGSHAVGHRVPRGVPPGVRGHQRHHAGRGKGAP